jgi:hypothetical protein
MNGDHALLNTEAQHESVIHSALATELATLQQAHTLLQLTHSNLQQNHISLHQTNMLLL